MSKGHTERLEAALDGKCRIRRILGEGGLASVYLAERVKHKRNVALKILWPELAAVIGSGRFLAEIETTAHLKRYCGQGIPRSSSHGDFNATA